ncbi:MAG TPA: PIN domain-containing protein [Vicinamibacteria bacterium]|nr:PIN domain-containing protein [Vicinamibacteria bacterium]
MIHLDTSFLIRALVRGSTEDQLLRDWLRKGEPLGMSTVAWAEFLCGPVDVAQRQMVDLIVSQRTPFAEDDAVLAARLFNDSGRRRGSLADCMIAAAAIREKAPLATKNPSDFERFRSAGLRILGG